MTLEDFIFNTPLYHKIDTNNGYDDIITSLVKHDNGIEIEGYNPLKKCDTTYYIHKGMAEVQQYSTTIHSGIGRYVYDSYEYSGQLLIKDDVKSIILKCKRYNDVLTINVFHNNSNNFLIKVGQYPSVADIHLGQVKQYNKVLDGSLSEFTKAIKLAANGVGIGSFVYLRRIFENLVFDAFKEAKNDNAIDEGRFNGLRMDEKIKSLNGYLPSFIVENHEIYGILSKGIHELTEEECLAYFDCMRQSIELILDEKLELLAKKKKQDEVKKTISSIASKLKK